MSFVVRKFNFLIFKNLLYFGNSKSNFWTYPFSDCRKSGKKKRGSSTNQWGSSLQTCRIQGQVQPPTNSRGRLQHWYREYGLKEFKEVVAFPQISWVLYSFINAEMNEIFSDPIEMTEVLLNLLLPNRVEFVNIVSIKRGGFVMELLSNLLVIKGRNTVFDNRKVPTLQNRLI